MTKKILSTSYAHLICKEKPGLKRERDDKISRVFLNQSFSGIGSVQTILYKDNKCFSKGTVSFHLSEFHILYSDYYFMLYLSLTKEQNH